MSKTNKPYVRVQVKGKRVGDKYAISQIHTWCNCRESFIEAKELQDKVYDAVGSTFVQLEKMGVDLKNVSISFKLYQDDYNG